MSVISRLFLRVFGLWLVASVFLGFGFARLLLPPQLTWEVFASAAVGGAFSFFVAGAGFCCLVFALIAAHRQLDARLILFAGLLATLMTGLLIALVSSLPDSMLRLSRGEALESNDIFRVHASLALSQLPFLLTLVGLLIGYSPVAERPQGRALQVTIALVIAISVAVAILVQRPLSEHLPVALAGWSPGLFSLFAIVVLSSASLVSHQRSRQCV